MPIKMRNYFLMAFCGQYRTIDDDCTAVDLRSCGTPLRWRDAVVTIHIYDEQMASIHINCMTCQSGARLKEKCLTWGRMCAFVCVCVCVWGGGGLKSPAIAVQARNRNKDSDVLQPCFPGKWNSSNHRHQHFALLQKGHGSNMPQVTIIYI